MCAIQKEEVISMKSKLKQSLRIYMSERLLDVRKANRLTQAKFSESLLMDTRSYSALEHGKNLCSMLTFVLYLVFFCKDPDKLLHDLRIIIFRSLDLNDRAS